MPKHEESGDLLTSVDFAALRSLACGQQLGATNDTVFEAVAAAFDAVTTFGRARGWPTNELAHCAGRRREGASAKTLTEIAAAPDRVEAIRVRAERQPFLVHDLINALAFMRAVAGIHNSPQLRMHEGPGREPAVYAKVRALLAKAESTEFPAEAEALTEKAQTLIARHAIDLARIDSTETPSGGDIVWKRVLIDEPYGRAKFILLSRISSANRVESVFNSGLLVATIVGAERDLAAVDVLFSSLLAQAAQAIVAAGTSPYTRRRGYRNAFMLSYAHRIGERLCRATASVMANAPADLLPVLADRVERLRGAVQEAFPHLDSMHVTASDGAGWWAGRVAADTATLVTDQALLRGS